MFKYDVSVVGEMMLAKLKMEGNLTHSKLFRMRTIGLGTILRHFETVGSMMVDKQILRDFLEKYHAEHHANDKRANPRWKAIRRAAELLIYFSETGRVDLPHLPHWTRRNCKLNICPTAEQMAKKDNIYSLIWNTRHSLKKIGYSPKTLRYYDQSGFSKILEAHIIAKTETYSEKICAKVILDTYELVSRGLLYRYQGARKATALLEEFYRYGFIAPSILSAFKRTEPTPIFEELLKEYGNDMIFLEGKSEVAVRTGAGAIRGFLFELEKLGFASFDGVTLPLIVQLVTQKVENYHRRGKEAFLRYVRNFLKHLYGYGYIDVDLSVGVPKMASSYKTVYQGFTDDEITRLLSSVDRNTDIGKRDYAMMVLAVQTGLRGGDIIKLKRDNIDWRKNEISIVQSKTGASLCISLEVESGNALCDYLLNARPDSDIPNIFLRYHRPIQSLSPQSTNSIVRKYMDIAEIEPEPSRLYGFHSFRRAFGTRLLEKGIPVYLLSQLLGHRDLNSAKPYMSTSEQGLSECCLSLDFDMETGGVL